MTTITSGQTLTVADHWNNSNTVNFTNVSGSGSEWVNSDGSLNYFNGINNLTSAVVQSGGTVTINSGGVDYADAVSGTQTVNSGGIASATITYGNQYIASGGQAIDGWMMGNETVAAGGSCYDIEVDGVTPAGASNGANAAIYGIATDAMALNSGTIYVEAGGVSISATAENGGSGLGSIVVSSGGVASGTTLIQSGEEIVSAGGLSISALVYYGSTEDVFGSATGANVFSGGTEIIESGATVSGGIIQSSGTLSGLVLSSGVLTVSNGAFVLDGIQVQSGAQVSLEIASGATASGFIELNQTETVDSGGIVSGNTVNFGTENMSGSAINTLVTDLGTLNVYGSSTNDTLVSGGSENVYGTANGVNVASGCTVQVNSGGLADNVIVSSGGSEMIAGGMVSGGSVAGGATISGLLLTSAATVSQGSVVIDGITLHSGAIVQLEIGSGGSITGLQDMGQYDTVDGGGAVNTATITSGATLDVFGSASNISVESGGLLISESGSTVTGGFIANGATVSGMVYSASNAITELNNSYAIAGATIQNGASIALEVVSAASISGFIEAGQTETIDSGGISYADQVYNAGQEIVNGTANSAVIYSGGSGIVNSGGVANGVLVYNGGLETINSGGLANNVMVNSGGVENISAGLVSGGSVADGGQLTGLLLSAGTAIAANGNISIDGIMIHSGAQVGLEVGSGAKMSGFIENGQTETVDSGAVTSGDRVINNGSDNVSGITSGAVLATGGSETVNSGGMAYGTIISSGSSETITSGGFAGGGVVYSGGLETVNSGGILSAGIINGGMIEFNAAADSHQSVIFVGSGGELKLDQPNAFQAVISGFNSGDIIDLSKISVNSFSLSKTNLLTVNETKSGSLSLQLAANQTFNGNDFFVSSDGSGGSYLQLFSSAVPTVSSVAYNASSGILSLSGSHFSTGNGNGNGVLNVADFSLSGDGGNSYTLTNGSKITGAANTNSVNIQLSAADQLAVDALLNKNGMQAQSGASYQLTASGNWDTTAAAINGIAVTVNQYSAPIVNSVGYDTATGVFTFTGSNLVNGINLHDFSLPGSTTGLLASDYTVSNLTANGFSLSPNSNAVIPVINALINADMGNLNLSTANSWDGDAGSANSSAIKLSSDASYNVSTGQLTLIGKWAATQLINVGDFTVSGENGRQYTLSNTDTATKFSWGLVSQGNLIQLSSADQLAILPLLDNNGSVATDGDNFTLSAVSGWYRLGRFVGAAQSTGLLVSSYTPPSLSTVSYNESGGVLTVTGNIPSSSIVLSDFSITAGNNSFHFNVGSDTLSNITANSFDIILNAADQKTVDAFLTGNGTHSIGGGTIYQFSAQNGWDGIDGNTANTLPLTVSNAAGVAILTGQSSPQGITADSAGNIYFADSSKNAIEELKVSASSATHLISTGLSKPDAVTLDGSGNLYFTDTGNNAIKEIAAGGNTPMTLLSSGLSKPDGIAVYQGSLYIADSGDNAIKAYNLSSHTLTTVLSVTAPSAIAVDSSGDLFITNGSGSLQELQHGAQNANVLLASGLSNPAGIAVDSAGNVYIADSGNNAIKEYSATLHTLTTLVSNGISDPTGISLDSNGDLIVSDNGSHALKTLNHYSYLLNTPLQSLEDNDIPLVANKFWENTGQLELSKSVFTAFAGQTAVTAVEFSNASHAGSPQDYLYYNANNGGLYYDAGGSVGGTYLEIAVIGVNNHPASLSLGDFKLVA